MVEIEVGLRERSQRMQLTYLMLVVCVVVLVVDRSPMVFQLDPGRPE